MLEQNQSNESQQGTERFYRMNDLATRVIGERHASKGLIGVSEKTLWEWVRKGEFPQPIKLSSTITVWRSKDISEWMKSKDMEA